MNHVSFLFSIMLTLRTPHPPLAFTFALGVVAELELLNNVVKFAPYLQDFLLPFRGVLWGGRGYGTQFLLYDPRSSEMLHFRQLVDRPIAIKAAAHKVVACTQTQSSSGSNRNGSSSGSSNSSNNNLAAAA